MSNGNLIGKDDYWYLGVEWTVEGTAGGGDGELSIEPNGKND